MAAASFPRGPGDIQTAVVNRVRRLAPSVAVARQPSVAHEIAEAIARRPSTMGNSMFVRQSLIRGGTATHDQVVEGLAAWVTVLFDLDNLQVDRRRALDLDAGLPDEALARLERARGRARNGCILAVPHIGSIELFASCLRDRGYDLGFVYTIGDRPTPTERWIHAGRSAIQATPIAFGRRSTGPEIAKILAANGIVILVVDVYPSARYRGIDVTIYGDTFRYPPGPARFAADGTLVLPGFVSRREAAGLSMNILDPIDHDASLPEPEAASRFTQRLADDIGGFTGGHPEAYWLWHPIPKDPFLAIAARQRPDLLHATASVPPDDEAVARAVEAMGAA